MATIEKIISRDNRRLVRIRKIRDGENSQEIFIEGRRLASEAIESKIVLKECFVSDEFRDRELVARILGVVPVFELPAKVFATIADTEQPQGIVLIARRPKPAASLMDFCHDICRSGFPHVVFLKEANNPSNLGAICRTAEAAGIKGLIVSPRSADAYSPKALRSSMGSSFRINIWESVEFGDVIDLARNAGMRIAAAEPVGGVDHFAVDWTKPTLIVFGSEAHGLTKDELETVDQRITIPLAADVESLNLAVAAGIFLFEAKRQLTVK